jgi:O-glycosyl hydrolase
MHSRIVPALALSAALTLDGGVAASAPNLVVDGAQRYQAITAVGVNVNVESWNDGELRPALDLLVNPPGAMNLRPVLRVVRDPMAWVASEGDIAPLHALDAATLARIYETPAMRDLWSTIAYLNAKGVRGERIVLNFMGWTPTWLGGSGKYGTLSHVTAGKEGEFATMVASLVYYGRRVRGLDFTSLAPLNEEDYDCLEGPCVTATQYRTVLHAIADELTAMGLNDVVLVGPDTADAGAAATAYISAMMADATVAGRIQHFGLHRYGASQAPGTAYAGRDYWLTETAAWCASCDKSGSPQQGEWAFARQSAEGILGSLLQGMAGALVWDGYDSWYWHHNAVGTYGLLAYDAGSRTYAPRKRYFMAAQVYGFVRPGAVRIGESDTLAPLGAVAAFFDSANGSIALIGQNLGGTPVTIVGQLNDLPPTDAFALFTTDSTTANLRRAPDVPVSGGGFTVSIPPGTLFTLASGRDTIPPVISDVAAGPITDTTATITWSTNEPATSRVDYGMSPDTLARSAGTTPLFVRHAVALPGLPPGTTVWYRVTSTDAASLSASDPASPDSLRWFATTGFAVGVPARAGASAWVSRAFPNPARHGVTFSITLPAAADVRASVADVSGREVWRLPARHVPAGDWSITWNGGSRSGAVGPGIYFARIQVGRGAYLRRFALVR